jgi:hypothetical protein
MVDGITVVSVRTIRLSHAEKVEREIRLAASDDFKIECGMGLTAGQDVTI